MKKAKNTLPIKICATNPPTKEQAQERVKKLAEYLGEIWNKDKGSG